MIHVLIKFIVFRKKQELKMKKIGMENVSEVMRACIMTTYIDWFCPWNDQLICPSFMFLCVREGCLVGKVIVRVRQGKVCKEFSTVIDK
jgi:hypothetical protein